ncbi:unnamed protein product [Brugia pahangi]|uniref:CASP-like protein n=1 Tax=Brugia pahangi TaxID=6280 RepID=A0A0N4TZE2_BRUPA|nr:unnamed protein product [Brugia pahangi]
MSSSKKDGQAIIKITLVFEYILDVFEMDRRLLSLHSSVPSIFRNLSFSSSNSNSCLFGSVLVCIICISCIWDMPAAFADVNACRKAVYCGMNAFAILIALSFMLNSNASNVA